MCIRAKASQWEMAVIGALNNFASWPAEFTKELLLRNDLLPGILGYFIWCGVSHCELDHAVSFNAGAWNIIFQACSSLIDAMVI